MRGGKGMAENRRVRIADIAEELGVSTATVSNVIHGKTGKISDETVKRVQNLLEEKQYIPSMAGILLAQNDSKIIGVVVNDHEKYESRVLEDGFVASSLNALSAELEKTGYFMMVKVTKKWSEIAKFASMWNMEGMVVIGFCEQDYKNLREKMHIPFVIYDGYLTEHEKMCNLIIDNYDGGFQMGRYLRDLGHKKVLCISDNCVCMDRERYEGFRDAMSECGADFLQIPMEQQERLNFYQRNMTKLRSYSAIFAVSDYYAIELMQFLMRNGVRIPRDISIAGFDDSRMCEMVYPALTTVRQDGALRARLAVRILQDLKQGHSVDGQQLLPVSLVKRQSVCAAAEKCRSIEIF